jgi:hypothetical protein
MTLPLCVKLSASASQQHCCATSHVVCSAAVCCSNSVVKSGTAKATVQAVVGYPAHMRQQLRGSCDLAAWASSLAGDVCDCCGGLVWVLLGSAPCFLEVCQEGHC